MIAICFFVAILLNTITYIRGVRNKDDLQKSIGLAAFAFTLLCILAVVILEINVK